MTSKYLNEKNLKTVFLKPIFISVIVYNFYIVVQKIHEHIMVRPKFASEYTVLAIWPVLQVTGLAVRTIKCFKI